MSVSSIRNRPLPFISHLLLITHTSNVILSEGELSAAWKRSHL